MKSNSILSLLVTFLAISIVFTGCQSQTPVKKDDSMTIAEVEAVITDWFNAHVVRDIDKITTPMSDKGDLVFINADDSVYFDYASLKEAYMRIPTTVLDFQLNSITISWMKIHSLNEIAWCAAGGKVTGTMKGRVIVFKIRQTFVLEKRNGKWVIIQTHYSIPASSDHPASGEKGVNLN